VENSGAWYVGRIHTRSSLTMTSFPRFCGKMASHARVFLVTTLSAFRRNEEQDLQLLGETLISVIDDRFGYSRYEPDISQFSRFSYQALHEKYGHARSRIPH